jgi:hypothetical protein
MAAGVRFDQGPDALGQRRVRRACQEAAAQRDRGRAVAAAQQRLDAQDLGLGAEEAVGEVAAMAVERGEGTSRVAGSDPAASDVERRDLGGEAACVDDRSRRRRRRRCWFR